MDRQSGIWVRFTDLEGRNFRSPNPKILGKRTGSRRRTSGILPGITSPIRMNDKTFDSRYRKTRNRSCGQEQSKREYSADALLS